MANYPLAQNIITTFVYIPVSLAWVLPMVYGIPGLVQPKGWASMEASPVAQWKWAVMGALDSIASVLQSIAIDKISNGSLVVLLLQAAIPASMVITYLFLKTKYSIAQLVGAFIVVAGILVVLAPSLGSGGDSGSLPWMLMLMGSCIPMCFSSVFKEKALGDVELDPIYFNLMVAVYQFILIFPLLPPSAYSVGVEMDQIFTNVADGLKCYVGINSVASDACSTAPGYVNAYLLFNIGYNILIILVLKYGSSNLLWLALTATVPVSDLVFAIPGIPGGAPVTWSVGVGLPVIFFGLVIYRFYAQARAWWRTKVMGLPAEEEKKATEEESELLRDAAGENEDSKPRTV
jgi:hypothetical protein